MRKPFNPFYNEAARTWLEKSPRHQIIPKPEHPLPPESKYPQQLLCLKDAPDYLYVWGNAELLSQTNIFTIVGARNASTQGEQHAFFFAQQMAQQGWHIASGLALGIDSAAHRGALASGDSPSTTRDADNELAFPPPPCGKTIAILGSGLEKMYPPQNMRLAEQIVAAGGAIVSEYPLHTPPTRYSFPQRNRLLAALSRGTLVVEASLNSGSLISARFANDLGREVFAVPGSIQSPLSQGCHALIKDGAKLTEHVQDILDEFAHWGKPVAESNLTKRVHKAKSKLISVSISNALTTEQDAPLKTKPQKPTQPNPLSPSLLPAADPLLGKLGFDEIAIDHLIGLIGEDIASIHAQLLTWELAGYIERRPGDRIRRL